MPKNIQEHAYIIDSQLAVGTLLPSNTFVLPGRTTVGITHHLFHKIVQKPLKPWRDSPLGYLLQNLQTLGLTETVKPKWLIFYCNMVWAQYKLDNDNHGPKQGTFNFQILHDLKNFLCHGKWSEVPYIQAFAYLHSKPTL
jgi:hypothetical protein